MKSNNIKTLKDLIEYGVEPEACEKQDYIYLWASDPDRSFYDPSMYKYDRVKKTLEFISSASLVAAETKGARPIKVSSDYLKKFL